MKYPSEEAVEVLKKSVIEHFLSGYDRILKEGGLLTPPIAMDEVNAINEVQLLPAENAHDAFNFNADFQVQHYKITFHGTVNVKKEITNEAFSGKKDFFV